MALFKQKLSRSIFSFILMETLLLRRSCGKCLDPKQKGQKKVLP